MLSERDARVVGKVPLFPIAKNLVACKKKVQINVVVKQWKQILKLQ